MSVLDDLPSPDAFQSALVRVTGSAEDGSGPAGVLELLEGLNPGELSASFSGSLGGQASATISVDTTSITGGATAELQSALDALPDNPEALVEPLLSAVARLRALTAEGLVAEIETAIETLGGVPALAPANLTGTLQGTVEGMRGLKGKAFVCAWELDPPEGIEYGGPGSVLRYFVFPFIDLDPDEQAELRGLGSDTAIV